MTNLFETDIKNCITVLENGGVILYPTDTVWGLGCDATNEKAVAKIYTIKKRIESKSMIALLPDAISLMQYVASPPPNIEELLEQYQDKPTTIIYDDALLIADNAIAQDGSMAFRICKEEFCFALLKRFRKSIISTSANISGEPTAAIYAEISAEIKNSVDYTVAYRQNDHTIASPSRILKLVGEEFVVIRE
jgi:L-threonylcarbamoyladenylate synthase